MPSRPTSRLSWLSECSPKPCGPCPASAPSTSTPPSCRNTAATETGVTTFFLDHDIDTGRVIKRQAVPILDTDNAEDVHDKLMLLGTDLVAETVDDILAERVTPIPQSELATDEPLRPAPKILKDTCHIDWSRGLKPTYDFIRGLSPYPAAWPELVADGKRTVLKIYGARKEEAEHTLPTGTVETDGKTYLKVALPGGYLHLLTLQLAGKRRMDVAPFLGGLRAGSLRVE